MRQNNRGNKPPIKKDSKTSWEQVHDWYSHLVGKQGHFYHQQVIIPKIIDLLKFPKDKTTKLLDLACGQGVLGRNLPANVEYWGVDLSPSLIREAKKLENHSKSRFFVGDITKDLDLPIAKVDVVTIILAIQDLADPAGAIKQASRYLDKDGRLLIVMNHPCFRIPRQSGWGVDEQRKLQYRRMDGYLSANKIPIQTKPSSGHESPTVTYFHYPLSYYIKSLQNCGLLVEQMDEWVSEKTSEGSKKKMEDRARSEFPLFLCIVARKV